MSGRKRIVYDTRFIAAIYYPDDDTEAARIKVQLTSNLSRYISSITVYELYKLTLEKEGNETADLRVRLLKQDFTIVNVDWQLAVEGAQLWKKYHIPMADALIAATALRLKATCVTNDEHLVKIKELRTRWI
jgi:predicted nucleic acid-binding protein